MSEYMGIRSLGSSVALRLAPLRARFEPTFEAEDVTANLAWNRWRWGSALTWRYVDRLGYAWGGANTQTNSSAASDFERYVRGVLPDRRDLDVVEVGAGGGRITAELLRWSRTLVASDISDVPIRLLAKRFGHLPDFSSVVAGAGEVPGREQSADLVVAYDVFVHAAPPFMRRFLRDAARVLRVDGQVVVNHSEAEDFARRRTAVPQSAVVGIGEQFGLVHRTSIAGPSGSTLTVLSKADPAELRRRQQLQVIETSLGRVLSDASEWNRRRIPTLVSTFRRLVDHIDLERDAVAGRPILEIGSDGQLVNAKVLHELTGRKVIATNVDISGLTRNLAGWDIEVRKNPIGRLEFDDESFSIIFGRAVLEHILDLDHFLGECYRVLAPGGVLYLDGGPLWPSPKGHHMAVKGPSGVHYGFDVMPNLLPDWCQLTMTADEIEAHLLANEVPPDDAAVVARYVTTSADQNRLSASDVVATFERSPLTVRHIDPIRVLAQPPTSLLGTYATDDLITNGLAVVADRGQH